MGRGERGGWEETRETLLLVYYLLVNDMCHFPPSHLPSSLPPFPSKITSGSQTFPRSSSVPVDSAQLQLSPKSVGGATLPLLPGTKPVPWVPPRSRESLLASGGCGLWAWSQEVYNIVGVVYQS